MRFFNERRDVVISIIVIILIVILMILFDLRIINFNVKNGDYYDSFVRVDDNVSDKINNNDNVVDNSSSNVNNNVESDNIDDSVYEDIDVYDNYEISLFEKDNSDSHTIWNVGNEILLEVSGSNLNFKISSDGKVTINNNKIIKNISNAVSLRVISPPTSYSLIYILTKNGVVYKYNTSYYDDANYNAVKVIDNIKQLLLYEKRSTISRGGCDYIIGIDNNNKEYVLNSFCI